MGSIIFLLLSFGKPTCLQARVLLLCTAAIQRIDALGQHSRLAVITPNKKQTLKHMVPLDDVPRAWEGNVVFPTFQVV